AGDSSHPWPDAFAQAPAPFGAGPAPPGIRPVAAGRAIGAVHRYYTFDATQNGAVIRVVVLDDSGQTLGAEQANWMIARLDEAQALGRPVIVVLGRPLGGTDDDQALARTLAARGVLAILAGGNVNQQTPIPSNVPRDRRITQYAGATVGYQRSENNGVS